MVDINKKTQNLLDLGRKIYNNKTFKTLIQFIVIVFCGLYVYLNFDGILNGIRLVDYHNIYVYFSISLSIVSVFIGGLAWWYLLRSNYVEVKFSQALNIHFSSNLAKYIPGYGWQLLGKFYLTYHLKKEVLNTSKLITQEMIIIIFSGFHLFTLTYFFPAANILKENLNIPEQTDLIIILLNILILLAVILLVKYNIPLRIFSMSFIKVIKLYLLIMTGWLINGLSFYFIISLFSSSIHVALSILILSAAFLFGFLIFIIPNSFGVREGVIAFLLTPLIGHEIGLVIAIIARVISIFAEIFMFLSIKLVNSLNNPK